MPQEVGVQTKQCFQCRFKAAADDEEWATTTHPSFGAITQCPECGSTNIHSVE